MSTHFKFNFAYDKQPFLDIFNNSEKSILGNRRGAVLPEGISNYEILQPFFEQFPFIQKHDASIGIAELTSDSLPRLVPSAIGTIIFPLSGTLSLKTYEFKFADPTSTWAYAIKTTDVLTTTMVSDIESTLIETVLIDSPIAVNGQRTHSVQTNGAIYLILNIPLSVQWDDVVTDLST